MKKVVEINSLSFAYREHPVLQAVNFSIESGDFVGVIGPNGGGKTTLLKLILGFYQPQKGFIKVFNKKPFFSKGAVGYVPQHLFFDQHFPITALGVVLSGLLHHKFLGFAYKKGEKQEALAALAATAIADKAAEPFGKLSGGQKQRVLISRALVSKPKLLLLDEPTASIDSRAQENIFALLEKLNQTTTIVVVSHDLSIIAKAVNKVLCVNKRVIAHHIKDLNRQAIEEIYDLPVQIIKHNCII